jgi:hypothetical protein
MVAEDDDAPPTIVVHEAGTGASFDFTPPPALWLDMQAFAAAAGLTIEELINRAVEDFFRREFPDV